MEIKIGVIGSVDCSKTTTVSCLKYDILDDGRGFARQKVLQFPHEKETGRTSSISTVHLKTNDNNFISFVDLAGHEKYLRTTLHGIVGYNIDYAMIVVGSNMGISKMTKEHLSVVVSLKIPIFIVIGKIDICPDHILKQTLADLEHLLKKTKCYNWSLQIENSNQINQVLDLYRTKDYFDICPIFMTSNKTGENLDLLKHFIHNLPLIKDEINDINETLESKSTRRIFRIHERFYVKGVGIVVSGQSIEGGIKKGDNVFIGPIMGNWTKLTVKSIHNNFREDILELKQNQTGCLALNFHDKKIKMTKYKIRKGIIIADKPYPLTRNFKAKIAITTGHSTTIAPNYQPIINCKTIVQAATICEMNKPVIRSRDVAEVSLRFQFRPEFINIGDIFIFREGNLRGIGKITELLTYNLSSSPSKQMISRRQRRRDKLQLLRDRIDDEISKKNDENEEKIIKNQHDCKVSDRIQGQEQGSDHLEGEKMRRKGNTKNS